MIKNTLDLATFGPVIPVIVLEHVEHAVPLARALVQGGVRVLEVTLRTKAALACIEAIVREVPDAIVGAGTLRTPDDVHAAGSFPPTRKFTASGRGPWRHAR